MISVKGLLVEQVVLMDEKMSTESERNTSDRDYRTKVASTHLSTGVMLM